MTYEGAINHALDQEVKFELDKSLADFSKTNRQMKAIGRNINQIAVRLHSTGNFYAEDMTEIKKREFDEKNRKSRRNLL